MAQDTIINTFNGGLNQDVDYILQPDGTYRNMKNGMLVSMDGHHFTVELAKGNVKVTDIKPRYRVDDTTYDIYPMPIGFVSFIDDLVVFSTNDTTDGGGYGEIGVIRFTRVQDQYLATYTPYYHHPNLNFSKAHAIEGFSYRENDTTERVYWTDNNNEPRVFDIGNPIFTTYIGTSGIDITSVIPKQYMVLKGVVEYPVGSGQFYGPCDGSGAPTFETNIFTSDGVNNTFTEITLPGDTQVIEYYPIELLDWTPSRSMGDITFSEYASGSKNYGANIYFYRLYSSDGNVQTTWSYPSSPIHVGGNNNGPYIGGTPYNDFVGNGSSTTIVVSDKSIKVRISDVDTNFDTIELCCMEFTQVNDVPYSTKIVAKSTITSSTMILEDTGTENLGAVTVSDLTLFPASILKVKTLTTDKNYILIANTTERNEFELDLTGVSLSQVEYPMVSHGDIALCINGNIPADVSPNIGVNPVFPEVGPYTRWLVTFGNLTTDTVLYEGNYYVTGDVIVGGSIYTTIYFTGSGAVRPCTTRNKYTAISGVNAGKRIENAIEFKDSQIHSWDYKNPAVASHNKGYWSNEKYRFGILFFDTKGNPFYVKWLGDLEFSTIYDKGGLMRKDAIFGTADYSYALNPSGLKIDYLDIPQSVIDMCKGFSIVRAPRDKRIITQGLLMQTYHNTATVPQTLRQIPTAYQDDTYFYNLYYRLHSILCPDWYAGYVTNGASSDIGYIDQDVEEACWFSDPSQQNYTGDVHNTTCKIFDVAAPDAYSPRERTLRNLNGNGSYSVDENAAVSDIDGSGFLYTNSYTQAAAAKAVAWNTGCASTGVWSGYDPKAVGCKKLVIGVDINHYGTTEEYGWPAQKGNHKKLMINFTNGKTKANQYGGNSDAALANTLYMSTGHFQPFDATTLSETYALKVSYTVSAGVLVLDETITGGTSGATGVIRVINGTTIYLGTITGTFVDGENITGGTSGGTGVIVSNEFTYTFNNIEVFGGDCFTSLIDLGYSLWSSTYFGSGDSFSCAFAFPCEGSVNYNLRRGRKVSNNNMYPNNVTGMGWDVAGSQNLEDFSYNKSYSTDGTNILYPALPLNYVASRDFEYRTRFAGVKYPGELVDSFRKFLTADYKDLDGQAGEINNIRSKEGRVIVWQNKGVSSVPILERQLLGATSGAATTIGTGGVVDRFDPISSFYGNQHQRGLVETEYGYMWFDMRTRSMCIMGSGGGIQEISLTKGLQSFFNNQFNEGDITALTASQIYNTNNSDTFKELPLMGYGIVGVYDPRYKMSYLTFKYIKDAIVDLEDELVTLEAKDFTVGYSHVLNVIVGFYDFTPGIYHNHNDLVLSANNSKNYVYYGPGMPPTTFNVGDVVRVNDTVANGSHGEYVCIKTVTMAGYPTSSVFNPAYPGSLYWTKINNESEIYLQTFNAEYCKFYGKVYDHELEIIVNPRTEGAVSFLNVQMKGSDLNYTSVYCDTDDQSSSDISISSTNRNYRYVNKSWLFSLPLSSKGRLKDHYVKVKYVLKNYVTNPTTAINTNKIVQFIKTWFVTKN